MAAARPTGTLSLDELADQPGMIGWSHPTVTISCHVCGKELGVFDVIRGTDGWIQLREHFGLDDHNTMSMRMWSSEEGLTGVRGQIGDRIGSGAAKIRGPKTGHALTLEGRINHIYWRKRPGGRCKANESYHYEDMGSREARWVEGRKRWELYL